jgi:hypothetical protein
LAASLGLASRSASPQAARNPSPVWPAQARVLPTSPGPYMPFSASPDLRAPDWPPRDATPPAAAPQPRQTSVPRSHFFQWGLSNSQRGSPLQMHGRPASPPTSPTYMPTSPTYSPTASTWQPSWGGGRMSSPPPPAALRQPTPTHVCEANCGFEGSKLEVLEHEKTCSKFAVWKPAALARRRESERKRKLRAQDAALTKLVAANTSKSEIEYQAYLAQIAADTKAAGKGGKAGRAKTSKASKAGKGRTLQPEGHASWAASEVEAREAAAEQAKQEHEAAERKAAQDKARQEEESSEHVRQRQKFCDDTETQANSYAKQLAENVPKFWTADAKPFCEVPRDSDEFKEIEAEVMLKLEIDKHQWRPVVYKVHALYRIINRPMWTAFELQRSLAAEAMKHAELAPLQTFNAHLYPNDCERLYHGTTLDAAGIITQHGFNRSAGTNGKHGSILGKGTYFSPLPRLSLSGEKGSLSNIYTPPDSNGFKHLLLCNVLIGNSIVGKSDYNVFPPGAHSTMDVLQNPAKICVQQDNSINILYEVVVSYTPWQR